MTGRIELRKTPGRGEGIFATGSFQRGDTVLTGVILKKLDENHSHASQVGEHEFVFHAGLTTKFNHSCDPNCGIKLNETGAHDFVAIRPIVIGEETTFDYAMRNFDVEYFPRKCLCGSAHCRGNITGWKTLPADRKEAYSGFVAPYLLDLDVKQHRRPSSRPALAMHN